MQLDVLNMIALPSIRVKKRMLNFQRCLVQNENVEFVLLEFRLLAKQVLMDFLEGHCSVVPFLNRLAYLEKFLF